MGGKNMYKVMDALEGVKIPIPNNEPSSGDKKAKYLGPHEMMLLLTIAKRQPDSTEDFPESECICYGDADTLSGVAHISRTSVFVLRKNLEDAGLIIYRKSGKFLVFNETNGRRKTFHNIYKLNWPKILEYKPRKSDEQAIEVQPADEKVRVTDEKVRVTDEKVRVTDEKVRVADKKVRVAYTKIKEDNKENSSSRSSSKDAVLPATTTDDDKSRELAKFYRQHIFDTYNLPKDADVGLESILKNTKGKNAEAVIKAINDFHNENIIETKFGIWISMLINQFKKINVSGSNNLTLDELNAKFSKPKQVEPPKRDLAKENWGKLYNELGLAELDAEKLAKVKKTYDDTISHISNDSTYEENIRILMDDVKYFCTNGMPQNMQGSSLAEIRDKLTLDQRCEAITKACEERTR